MMLSLPKHTAVCVLLLLAGCASAPKTADLGPVDLHARFERSRVDVRPVDKPVLLAERTKSQAVGNFLVSSLVSSAVMSGGGAASPQQVQSHAQIGQTFGQQLNQALPTTQSVSAGQGVDQALAGRLAAHFQAREPAPDAPQLWLRIQALQWELAYQSFWASSEYALKYHLNVTAEEDGQDGPRRLKQISCQGEADRRLPLEQWQADEYRAVDEAGQKVVDACLRKVLLAFGTAE